MYARITEAVPSGRRVRDDSSRSVKVYISFSTISVVSPIARANNSVFSITGRMISANPYVAKEVRACDSSACHKALSSGRISRNPLTAAIFMHSSYEEVLWQREDEQSMWKRYSHLVAVNKGAEADSRRQG